MGREDHRPNHYENLRTNRKQGNKNMTGAGAPCNNENKQGKWWACINGAVREGLYRRGDVETETWRCPCAKGRKGVTHGTACEETLVRKGCLVEQRGHTADRSWTQGSVLLLTPVPHCCLWFNWPLSWILSLTLFQILAVSLSLWCGE